MTEPAPAPDEPVALNGGPAPRLTPLSTVLWQSRLGTLLALACIAVLFIPASLGVRTALLAALWLILFAAWWVHSLRFAHPLLELRWNREERRAGGKGWIKTFHRFDMAWQQAGGDPNPRHEEIAAALDRRREAIERGAARRG